MPQRKDAHKYNAAVAILVIAGVIAGITAVSLAKPPAAPAAATDAPAVGGRDFIDPATPKDAKPASPNGHWVLTFSDEFNAGALNQARWKALTASRGKGNHDVKWGWDAANVTLDEKSGRLEIATKKAGEDEFHSGNISSAGLFAQQYGFFEARIQAPPKNNGHQAAFWLMPAGGQMGMGKPGSEIDVIETHSADNKGTSTLHWNGYKKGEHKSASRTWNASDLHEGMHTYGVEWSPKMLRFYYDGKLVWTYEGEGIPQVEEHVICSVGIIGWVDGDIRKAKLPQYTYFDWVRVYAEKPQ